MALAGAAPALAQSDPGQLLQQRLRQQEQLERRESLPKQEGPGVVVEPVPRAELPKPGGPTVLIKTITFDPSAFLSPGELDAISARYRGQRLDFSGLQRVLRDVNDLYAAKGIVTAAASLPPQKFSDGILKVRLVEGRIGNVVIENRAQTRESYILARVPLEPGEVVNVPATSHAITAFNRTSDAQLRLLLQPGQAFGLTDLRLAVTEPPRNVLQTFVDNQGVKATGASEAGILIKRNGLLGIDDRLTFYGTKSLGNLSETISYNLPISPWGTRLGVSYGRGDIRIVNGPTRFLHITGWSQTSNLSLSQPLFINDNFTLQALASIGYGTSNSRLSGTPMTNSQTIKGTTGFSLTWLTGMSSITVAPTVTFVDAHSSISYRTTQPVLWGGTANGLVKLPYDFSLQSTASLQWTSKPLLPGDLLFEVGGPTTVRGYPTNGLSGDSGFYANLELHKQLFPQLDVFAFFDAGRSYATFPAQKSLFSAGAGLSFTPFERVTADLAVAFPLKNTVAKQNSVEVYGRILVRAF